MYNLQTINNLTYSKYLVGMIFLKHKILRGGEFTPARQISAVACFEVVREPSARSAGRNQK